MLLGVPAAAQTGGDTAALINRIHQLENQIQTLSRAVYRGDKLPDSMVQPPSAAPSVLGAFESRVSDMEERQRALTGDIEKLNFQLQQIKTQMERLQVDTEQRFQHLNAAPPSAVTETSAAAPPAAEGASGVDSASALYEAAFADIRDAHYDQAERGFRDFLRKFPTHTLAANAHYWLGETYYVRGDFKQSAKVFAKSYQDYPQGPKAVDSLLKLGLSLSKLGQKEDACLSLRQMKKEFAGAAPTLEARADQEIRQLACP